MSSKKKAIQMRKSDKAISYDKNTLSYIYSSFKAEILLKELL